MPVPMNSSYLDQQNNSAPKYGMVRWYDPGQLFRTGIEVVVSTLFGRHSDSRRLPVPIRLRSTRVCVVAAIRTVLPWSYHEPLGARFASPRVRLPLRHFRELDPDRGQQVLRNKPYGPDSGSRPGDFRDSVRATTDFDVPSVSAIDRLLRPLARRRHALAQS